MNFKRNPSKVFYGNDSVEYRENSSPASQEDSGFSDTETSPKNKLNGVQPQPAARRIPKDIFKELTNKNECVRINLSENYREKITPSKEKISSGNDFRKIHTDPVVRKQRYYRKNSPVRVSRNLFKFEDNIDNNVFSKQPHQNSNHAQNDNVLNSASEECSSKSSLEECFTKSLPVQKINKTFSQSLEKISESAPSILQVIHSDEEVTNSDNSFTSDCESELEFLFKNGLDSPVHTSTPKLGKFSKMRHSKLKKQRTKIISVENPCVQKWLSERRFSFEPECMTTLQCKSIALEVHQIVAHLAAKVTENIRIILHRSRCIETDYKQLNSEQTHMPALIQSTSGNILDFIKCHSSEISCNILNICDEIRIKSPPDSVRLLSDLFSTWQKIRNKILTQEVKKLVEKLESPSSELDLKSTVTGITSVCLRHEEVIEMCVSNEIIPILLVFCEKCEGSSVRTLLLRALSTMCCNANAVRYFERYMGIQLISEILKDELRPEPEKTETVALLAQTTAPWIEDNIKINGLKEYSSSLVTSLTKIITGASCGQTLLLSTAALSNLASIEPSSINYMLSKDTPTILLNSIGSRRHITSVHLLEQTAGLLASLAGSNVARKKLVESGSVEALLFFVNISKKSTFDGDTERRLLQKSVVALSRLCGEKSACNKLVDLNGMDELVKLCREKDERKDSDAVLVAALATLRKVVDACGSEMLNSQDIQELVKPKLLDSFLAYSTQNESYV